MFERFTAAARGVVVHAQEQARALGSSEILPEHLVLGVLADRDGIGPRVLRDLGVEREALVAEVADLDNADARADAEALRSIGVDLDAVRRSAEAAFGRGALDRPLRRRSRLFRSRAGTWHLPFSGSAKRALEQSLREAKPLGHGYLGTGHLLLGLLADEQDPAAQVLRRLGVDPAAVRARVLDELRRAA